MKNFSVLSYHCGIVGYQLEWHILIYFIGCPPAELHEIHTRSKVNIRDPLLGEIQLTFFLPVTCFSHLVEPSVSPFDFTCYFIYKGLSFMKWKSWSFSQTVYLLLFAIIINMLNYICSIVICNFTGKAVPPLGFGAFSDTGDDNSSTQRLLSSGTFGTKGDGKSQVPLGKKILINVGPSSYSKDEIAVLRYIKLVFFLENSPLAKPPDNNFQLSILFVLWTT